MRWFALPKASTRYVKRQAFEFDYHSSGRGFLEPANSVIAWVPDIILFLFHSRSQTERAGTKRVRSIRRELSIARGPSQKGEAKAPHCTSEGGELRKRTDSTCQRGPILFEVVVPWEEKWSGVETLVLKHWLASDRIYPPRTYGWDNGSPVEDSPRKSFFCQRIAFRRGVADRVINWWSFSDVPRPQRGCRLNIE